MRISILSVFKTAILIVLTVGIAVGGYLVCRQAPRLLDELTRSAGKREEPTGKKIIVEVPKGASLSQVATILQEKGVVSSALVFKLVAMIRGEQRSVKAGEYELKTGSEAGDILDQLISGKTLMFAFTIPEGYTIYQTADLVQSGGIMSRDAFLMKVKDKKFIRDLGIEADSLEGYLFPDTYFLRASERKDGEKLIRRMVTRFHEVYDRHVRGTAEQYGWKPQQVVTLASLVEKEATRSEHALVSSVFHNRLQRNMKLQCDPTVIYGIKPMGSKITYKDLRRRHPYNTYQNKGLPAGPIASPGKESLVAAVKPANTNYLYFVAKNDGTHQFSKTLREHNRGVNLYQRRAKKKK